MGEKVEGRRRRMAENGRMGIERGRRGRKVDERD